MNAVGTILYTKKRERDRRRERDEEKEIGEGKREERYM